MLKNSWWARVLQQEGEGVDEVTPQHLASALWATLMGQIHS